MESSVVKGLIRHTLKEQRLQPQTCLQSSSYFPRVSFSQSTQTHHRTSLNANCEIGYLLSVLNIFHPLIFREFIKFIKEKMVQNCTNICMFN